MVYCILAPNKFPHSSPEAPRIIQMRETSISEGGNYYQILLANSNLRKSARIVYMPQSWTDSFTSPSEGRHTEDFPDTRKIQRFRPGLNPRTRVPVASMLTTRPPKPSYYAQSIIPDLITRRVLGEESRSLSSSLRTLLHSSLTSSFLGSNIFLTTLFPDTRSLCPSLDVTDGTSHPCNAVLTV